MASSLTQFKAISFDCYGTLIDWETGIWDAFQPLLMANPGADRQREDLLEAFSRFENEVEREHPKMNYREVLSRVHSMSAGHFNLDTGDELNRAFGESVAHWPAFSDTAGALRELKSRYKLVILSNVDRASFAASNRKLGVEFDLVCTAEDIGSYKPSPDNFRYMLDHIDRELGIPSDQVLHTAQSLYHDHAPARHLGLANAWIDRQRLSEDGGWGATRPLADRPEVDYLFFTMAEMAAAVRSGR